MQLPTAEAINSKRLEKLKQEISDARQSPQLDSYRQMIMAVQNELDIPAEDLAAILLQLNRDFALVKAKPEKRTEFKEKAPRLSDNNTRDKRRSERSATRPATNPEEGMESYRIEIGHQDKVTPGNIVGCIANEAEIDSEYIGRIQIFDDHSLVDLPEGMPKDLYRHLKKAWVCGKQLNLTRLETEPGQRPGKKSVQKPSRQTAKKTSPRKRKADRR